MLKFLESGVLTVSGRDEKFRPIITFDMDKAIFDTESDIEIILDGFIFF